MPENRETEQTTPAAAKKPRARKPRAAASATTKTKSKPRTAAKKAEGPATSRRRTSQKPTASATARKSPPKRVTKPAAAKKATPVATDPGTDRAPAPILPVSAPEPAAASFDAPDSASRVSDGFWNWAGAPIAATVAFLATLGALLVGYWTGYAVGNEAVGKTAVTVASAAEKTVSSEEIVPLERNIAEAPAETPEAVAETIETATIETTEIAESVEPETVEPRKAAEEGLHLQVSALKSEQAASELQRELESRGYPVRVEAPAEDELVRVYVGPIADSDVSEWASALRKEGLEPFPKRL